MRLVSWLNFGLSLAAGLVASLAMAADIPRLADGRPDFNGVWQVLNTANYDLLAHPAGPAMMVTDGPLVRYRQSRW